MSLFGKIIKGIKIDKEKGFTLIELMIVVAILGILAAIAIPNFMRFQAKSKQSEAKTNLGAIGTTVEAYRTEHDDYVITDSNADGDIWDDMGWAPQGNTRYAYGYDGTQIAGNPVIGATGTCAPDAATPAVAASTTVFLAVADGDLGDGDGTCDQWTYNQVRALNNTVNDVGT